jgi:hypothetical protein
MAWVSVCDDQIVCVQPVQVLDLDYLDLLTGFHLERIDVCSIGAALVDCDLAWQTMLPADFLESVGCPSCREGVCVLEVYALAVLVNNGAVLVTARYEFLVPQLVLQVF